MSNALLPAIPTAETTHQEEKSTPRILLQDEKRLKCILKCVLGLSEEEAQVLAFLIVYGDKATVKDISSKISRNPEVVRRALRKLYSKNLVERQAYPLRRGGRAYIYSVKNKLVDSVKRLCNEIYRMLEDVAATPSTPGNGCEGCRP